MTTPLNQKDSQQIAREAADSIYRDGLGSYPESMAQIILSAIERATEQTAEHFRQVLYRKLDKAMALVAAAQPQPVQCTHPSEDVCSMCRPQRIESQQQIAREARIDIDRIQPIERYHNAEIEGIILSSLERATERLQHSLDFYKQQRSEPLQCTCEAYDPRGAISDPDCPVHDQYGEERPSLKQEWTVEGKAIWNDCNPVGIAASSQEAHKITNAHNAAIAQAVESAVIHPAELITKMAKVEQQLAAEREHRKLVDKVLDNRCLQLRKLEKQLAAERQLVEWCEVHAPTKDEPIKCCPCCEAVNERQRREQAEHWLGELLAVIHCDGGHYQSEHGIEKATNDAIEKRNQLVARVDVLEYQLLSALAAIEKAKEVMRLMHEATLQASGSKKEADLGRKSYFAFKEFIDQFVDLSALHEHDEKLKLEIWRTAPEQPDIQEAVIAKLDLVHRHAIEKAVTEVRKPLVEAMTLALTTRGNARQVLKDALAKVKEQ